MNHSNNTGPSSDHTSGNGGYIFTEANTGFGGSNVFTSEIVSPLVDVSPLTIPELSFYYHMYGSLINKLVVQVRSVGGNWTTLETISGAQQRTLMIHGKKTLLSIAHMLEIPFKSNLLRIVTKVLTKWILV